MRRQRGSWWLAVGLFVLVAAAWRPAAAVPCWDYRLHDCGIVLKTEPDELENVQDLVVVGDRVYAALAYWVATSVHARLDIYDLDFTKAISEAVKLPVIASGGAGTLEHFYEGVAKGGAEILLAASVFHYRLLTIGQVKQYLRDKGLEVNL